MKKFSKDLVKKRFEALEEARRIWNRDLSMKNILRLEEDMLSSELVWQLRRNFLEDEPVSLKCLLRKRR